MSRKVPVHTACTDCGREFSTPSAPSVVRRHCRPPHDRGCPWCEDCYAMGSAGVRLRRPGAA